MPISNKSLFIENILKSVKQNKKYIDFNDEIIKRIITQEMIKHSSEKVIIKNTRKNLHQLSSSYLISKPNCQAWLGKLTAAQMHSEERFNNVCLNMMELHASTKERLSILDSFFEKTLAGIHPINSILDLACGFNPLMLNWIPKSGHFSYYACDIFNDLIDFLNGYFKIKNIQGNAFFCDLLSTIPCHKVDLALLLKTLPLLEHTDKNFGQKIIEDINAKHILISYPVKSISGKEKGMVNNYTKQFMKIVAGKDWIFKMFEFPTEIAFLVSK